MFKKKNKGNAKKKTIASSVKTVVYFDKPTHWLQQHHQQKQQTKQLTT